MKIGRYELISEWKNSQCGQTAYAQRSGMKYFIKKYQTPVKPMMNGALDKKTYEANKEYFQEFVKNRKKINSILRALSGTGGNIIVPAEEFVYENYYVEVSEFVNDTVSDEEIEAVLSTLSIEVKKFIMLTATGALASIHSKGVIHSDLKLKNILISRNSLGDYVAKIIDFDSSYLKTRKPIDDIIGDINYYSPELGLYADAEDEREKYSEKLTEKSDIFSLGLVFHYYLTGEFPTATSLTERLKKRQEKGKVIYCWVMLVNGCELVLSSKIRSKKYKNLISSMLDLEPEKRPAALEVLKALKEEVIDIIDEPWPEHLLIINETKLKEHEYISIKKKLVSRQKKYALYKSDGKEQIMTNDKLLSLGIAESTIVEDFEEPWEDHNIEFDKKKLRSRGFIAAKKKKLDYRLGYELTRTNGRSNFFTLEMLSAMQYIKPQKSHSESGYGEPWPEHNIILDVDVIKQKGYTRMEQKILSGIKGYMFYRDKEDKGQFIKLPMLLMLKMAKKI